MPTDARAEVRAGQPLQQALHELNQRGANLMFSSKLVEEGMRVEATPTAGDALDIAREILAPHRLAIIAGPAGRWIVTRVEEEISDTSVVISGRVVDGNNGELIVGAEIASGVQIVSATADGNFSIEVLLPGEIEIQAEGYESGNFAVTADHPSQVVFRLKQEQLEELTVIASRYLLFGQDSSAELNHEDIDRLPHLADDVLRAVHRLPAVAANDLSARFSLRGGYPDETALRLDGLELIDPFHLKDLTGVFSIVDSNLVESAEVLPGGFPVQFGDHASGVVNINSLSPPEESVHSIGVSFINAFVNTRGSFDDQRGGWLASVRRGYLDLLVDDRGSDTFSPKYLDALATIEHDIGERHTASMHILLANEDLDITDLDFNAANADFRLVGNSDALFLWARVKSHWSDQLQSENVLWRSDVDRMRDINVDDPSDTSADLLDKRNTEVLGIRSDWQWRWTESWTLSFGVEIADYNVDYDYRLNSTSNQNLYPGQPAIDRRTLRNVAGETYGVYTAVRRTFGRLNAEIGWRWDTERYTGFDEGFSSPRLGLQYDIGERTRLTASWGHYNQFQRPEALQVEDGVDEFFPATRSEHRIVGIEYQLSNSLMLRGAAYQKLYRPLIPRYTNLFDRLEAVPEANPDRVLVDASSAEARGLELGMRYRSNTKLSWWASYALTRAEDEVDGQDVARNWDERHAINLVANWHGDRWNFNVATGWHSGWPRTNPMLGSVETPAGPQIGVVPGERNADNYDDYSRVDIRVSRDVQLKRGEFTYYFEAYNLFDTKNTCCVDDIDIVSGPVLRLDEEDWGGVLPSFGFTWTFH